MSSFPSLDDNDPFQQTPDHLPTSSQGQSPPILLILAQLYGTHSGSEGYRKTALVLFMLSEYIS